MQRQVQLLWWLDVSHLKNSSKLTSIDVVLELVNNSMASDSEDKARDEAEMEGMEKDYNSQSDDDGTWIIL